MISVKKHTIAIDEKMDLSNKKIKRELAAAEAKIFHVQAVQLYGSGAYIRAAVSFMDTIPPYLRCAEEMNFRRTLEGLRDCLCNLNSKDMEEIRDEGYDIDKRLKDIAKKYDDNRYTDLILEIKKELKSSHARKAK